MSLVRALVVDLLQVTGMSREQARDALADTWGRPHGLPDGHVPDAGDDDGPGLPAGAIQYRNDAGGARFLGAAPPPGPAHRYFINVYALDTADLGVPADAPPALLGFNLFQHTIGRAQMIVMAGGD